MAPFLAALAIFLVVVTAIVVLTLTGGDGLSEEQRVARAAVGQNDALQRQSYPDFLAYTCSRLQGSEADVLARQQDSDAKNGARNVDDVTDVRIDGDRASAAVIYHFENAPDTKTSAETVFAREDGSWKVCSPGPL